VAPSSVHPTLAQIQLAQGTTSMALSMTALIFLLFYALLYGSYILCLPSWASRYSSLW